jgi:hypothetical protein
MAFKKDAEIKVYKKGDKVGPKMASEDKTNRFTVDDLISQDNKNDPNPFLPTKPKEEKVKEEMEDVSS